MENEKTPNGRALHGRHLGGVGLAMSECMCPGVLRSQSDASGHGCASGRHSGPGRGSTPPKAGAAQVLGGGPGLAVDMVDCTPRLGNGLKNEMAG
jgi:hypothetical protein